MIALTPACFLCVRFSRLPANVATDCWRATDSVRCKAELEINGRNEDEHRRRTKGA